jgi:membrane fusion protein (multidrug efflux system)|tara:strand:- start:13325 stop:14422 length:1098 start_codon:yes stop_codon:yes gene_type:complete
MYKYALLSIAALTITLPNVACAQKMTATPKATPVIVAPVTKRDFADQIEALATTKSNESVIITADRSEKIAAIYFEDGQDVQKGSLLVTLDKRQEEAELRASEALTAERQSSYNRAKSLSGNSALPKATLQARLAELKQSQADTQAIKAGLESYEITAPFDGVLGLREVSVGTLVQPGDTITTIDDLSQIKVDFDVPSVFLTTLKPGLPITGRIDAFGDKEFTGVISAINTRIDPITRTIRIRAIMPNEDGILKPGLLMSLKLSKNLRQSLLIPEEALVKRGAENYVFLILQNGSKRTVQQTKVEIGTRQPGIIEIISGLTEGDIIVSHGLTKVRDGGEVTIRAQEDNDTPLVELLKQNQQNDGK